MIRLFVSVELPENIKDEIDRIRNDVPGARWIDRDQLHLTIRFIGEVEEPSFRLIEEALAGVVSESFVVSLSSVGHFPLRGRPTVLWAGVEAEEGLFALRHRIEHALVRAGISNDKRKFHPHVTLARLRGTRVPVVGSFIAQHGLFRSERFRVEAFHLFSSRLSPKRALHTREASYPLG